MRCNATPTRIAIGLSSPVGTRPTVGTGELSPWQSILPPQGGGTSGGTPIEKALSRRRSLSRATGKHVSRHLLQDEPLDGFGPAACVGPPPSVLMHGPGGGNEAIRDGLEVGIRVV